MGWVIQGWGGSCRCGVDCVGVVWDIQGCMGYEGTGVGGSCRGGSCRGGWVM